VAVTVVVEAGLRVVELAGEAGVVLECPKARGVLVGLGHPVRVGAVPAPHHLVVGCPCDDPGRAQVVGIDVVDAGDGGVGRDGLHGVGGHGAGGGRAELDGDRGGRSDGLKAEVSPGGAAGGLVDRLDGGAVGVGAAEGVLGVGRPGRVGDPAGLEVVFRGAGNMAFKYSKIF